MVPQLSCGELGAWAARFSCSSTSVEHSLFLSYDDDLGPSKNHDDHDDDLLIF